MSDPVPLLAPLVPAKAAQRVWKSGQFTLDPWQHLADDEQLPAEGAVTVSIERWPSIVANVFSEKLLLGLRAGAGNGLKAKRETLGSCRLIMLTFAKFTDGRPYSIAQQLRTKWGFQGELRATGDVLFDQIPLMLGCGFDTLEIVDAATIRQLEKHAPVAGAPRPRLFA